jgi:hypothetical protein
VVVDKRRGVLFAVFCWGLSMSVRHLSHSDWDGDIIPQ